MNRDFNPSSIVNEHIGSMVNGHLNDIRNIVDNIEVPASMYNMKFNIVKSSAKKPNAIERRANKIFARWDRFCDKLSAKIFG